jgi:hypothetical protein
LAFFLGLDRHHAADSAAVVESVLAAEVAASQAVAFVLVADSHYPAAVAEPVLAAEVEDSQAVAFVSVVDSDYPAAAVESV